MTWQPSGIRGNISLASRKYLKLIAYTFMMLGRLKEGKREMAGDGYTINQMPAGEKLRPADFQSEPLTPQEVNQMRKQAEHLRMKMDRSGGLPTKYDAAAIKRLSDDVNRLRDSINEEKKEILANMYGMFLGEALLLSNPDCAGKWVRMQNGDIAIRWDKPKNDMAMMFTMPISRVFKQFEHGEKYSMLSLFQAMPAQLSNSPQSAPLRAPAAARSTPTAASNARQEESLFAKFRRILNNL